MILTERETEFITRHPPKGEKMLMIVGIPGSQVDFPAEECEEG